ncbi:MAG: DUF3015 domain-containing protein [Nitrospira sp.]|nr:DUF3015 domain-containing protein [Nitrospira sp.]MDH4304578.1 DUF3015 domain-containing protein [Nitrospira sp.]MDH5194829.1 DUF3015 domain-containing protein [Nitrospira sp.]
MQNCVRCLAAVGASLVLGLTGCTIKSTLEQITDTTSNVTGTTSGAAWWNEDGHLKPDFKTTAFVSLNYDNLQHDLAAGQGEYLASVSRLLGVPSHQEPAFFSEAQAGYATIGDQGPTALLTLLRDRAQPFVN